MSTLHEKPEQQDIPDKPLIPPELLSAIEALKKETTVPTVTLKPIRSNTTPYSSKLGGTPYLPPRFEYPCNKDDAGNLIPLKLLAQLNFEELPKLKDFPEHGILQFFVEPDDLYGADFDTPTEQIGYRVIYHETLEKDASLLESPPKMPEIDEDFFPFQGEFLLTAEPSQMPISLEDFRFDQVFSEIYRRFTKNDFTRVWDLDDEIIHLLQEELTSTGHRMGGYAFFTQEDPRTYDENLSKYTTLLLQIDSDGKGADEIMWGDCGVAGFFITPEQLKSRDFSKVLYNWDCG